MPPSARGIATGSRSRSTRRRARSSRDGVYRFEGREKSSAEMPAFWAEIVDRYPVVSIEDGAAEDDWESWQALTERARRPRAARRRRPVRDEPGAAAGGNRPRRRQLDPRQGEPDRDADRDDRGRPARAAGRLHARSCRTARARPRTRRSPISRSRSAPARSRRARRRASDRVAKYNQLLRIEEELGARATYPGWGAFPRSRR